MSIKTLEIFAGIGGIRLGFESVGGFEFAQAIEISPTARAVYGRHFPDTPIWDDARTFSAAPRQFDCIVGGSPCQDLSGCGAKQGLDGERSSLWWEMLRIISECRPNFVGWENVEGALHRGARKVIASLRMVGYQVENPILVSAAELGAPHQRKRIFVTAYANHLSLPERDSFTDWEEQIGKHLAIAREYSHPASQRWGAGLQHRKKWGNEPDGILKTEHSGSPGLQRNFPIKEAGVERHFAGQFAPLHPPNRISQPPSLGLADGIPEQLVRIGTDAPWLCGVRRSGWWQRDAPIAGLRGKRIAGRRDSISHYGAACVPAQVIPLALRIKFLQKLLEDNK